MDTKTCDFRKPMPDDYRLDAESVATLIEYFEHRLIGGGIVTDIGDVYLCQNMSTALRTLAHEMKRASAAVKISSKLLHDYEAARAVSMRCASALARVVDAALSSKTTAPEDSKLSDLVEDALRRAAGKHGAENVRVEGVEYTEDADGTIRETDRVEREARA